MPVLPSQPLTTLLRVMKQALDPTDNCRISESNKISHKSKRMASLQTKVTAYSETKSKS